MTRLAYTMHMRGYARPPDAWLAMQIVDEPESLAIRLYGALRTQADTDAPRSSTSHARKYEIEVVERWQDLESQTAAWDDLAANALEPNPFYAARQVLAAMRHLQPAGEPAFLIVRASSTESLAPFWCGFFPFMRFRTYRGVLLANLRLLRHDYCFLRVPLLRAGHAAEVLRLVFAWLDRSDAALAELSLQTGSGEYATTLQRLLREREGHAWLSSSHARALLVRAEDDESYLERSVSHKKLKELRRQQRRLGEKSELRFEALSPSGDVDIAIEEFLALERAGWKGGREGTAMACRTETRAFFAEFVRETWHADQLRLTTLRLGGRAVAMKCNLLARPGSFAFKIAYDETLARFSPGVLLEIDNIRRFHGDDSLAWMDSCADPDHPMIEHLWNERRLIQSWLIPLGPWGRLAIAAIPLLRRIRRSVVSSTSRKLQRQRS